MTYTLPPDSPKGIKATRIGHELRKAMTARGIGSRTLATGIGVSRSRVSMWLTGQSMPKTDVAELLAAALNAPQLAELITEARTEVCRRCGTTMRNDSGGPKRYCSTQCRQAAKRLHSFTGDARQRADLLEGQLDDALTAAEAHRVAVAAMCRSCEPDGVCRVVACALRPVSPLPMAHGPAAHPLTPAPGPWGPESREKTLSAIRVANEARWARAGQREAQRERNRKRHAQ